MGQVSHVSSRAVGRVVVSEGTCPESVAGRVCEVLVSLRKWVGLRTASEIEGG